MNAPAERPGNLPRPSSPLVGRRAELETLQQLLASTRLLTLTGPGGSGKTRLAVALAERIADGQGGGAWWVGLAGVDEDGLVGQASVDQLGVGQLPARAAVDALHPRLGGEPALLVLDNCEQVAAGCAELAAGLLAACPELTVVATSRQPLAMVDEQVFRVSGLPVGPGQEGAVELFLARARRHLPTLGDDEQTMAAVASICERLEGIPLAIELAAARTPMMTVAEIAVRLADDNRLLKRRASGIPARQQSLEAALDWSYRLLVGPQQAVFRRLGVFRGTFSLDGAEAVAAGGEIDRADVLDAMAALVDQSLVDASQTGEQTRYRLLLTVRQYAEERLADSGEAQATRERHLAHFATVLHHGNRELGGAGQAHWLDQLETEHDNLRAALAFAYATDAESATRMAGDLWEFWYRHGHYQEGRRWLEQIVDTSAQASPQARVALLSGAAAFAILQCDYPLARARLEQCLVLHRELDDRAGVATTLQRLGAIAREQADYAGAEDLHRQSLAIWEELGDDAGVADSFHYLGFALWLAADYQRAESFCERALDLYSQRSELQEVAAVKVNLGVIAHYLGDDAHGIELLDEGIELAGQLSSQEGLAWALHERAVVAAANHELGRTAELLAEALRLHWELGDLWRATRVVEDIAGALLVRSEPSLAARLLATADRVRTDLGAPVPTAERPAQEAYLESVRRTLSAAELEAARTAGVAGSLAEAVDEAAEAVRRLYLTTGEQGPRAEELLTPRERDVLQLLGQGRTNREIGAALFISGGTAGVHVSSILRKLNARTRAEAVTRAHQLGLLQSDGARPA